VPLPPDLTIGAEEELFLVDAETLQPADGASLLLPHGDTRFLKHELFECIVELTTPVMRSAREVAQALATARNRTAVAASAHGLRLLASGAFPTAVECRSRVTDTPHYQEVAEHLGPALYGQLVCGLHIHVGLGTRERALNALEGVIPWLPEILAVSVNSALGEGDDAALLSVRSARLAELDVSPLPPPGGAPAAGSEAGWWDARFNPRWGTLEVRVPDQPTDVGRSGAIVALVQALAVTADSTSNPAADRLTYERRRERAARGDVDPRSLAPHIEAVSRRLGTWDVVTGLLAAETEGARQRRLRAAIDPDTLVRALLDLTVRSDPPEDGGVVDPR